MSEPTFFEEYHPNFDEDYLTDRVREYGGMVDSLIISDELSLWNAVKNIKGVINWELHFDKLNISRRIGFYIINKWEENSLIDYGVSIRFGWIKDKVQFQKLNIKEFEWKYQGF